MQQVDADALVPGTVYEIFYKGDPADGVPMIGAFSGPYDSPFMSGLIVFKNVTKGGRPYQLSMSIPKAEYNFYKPPLTGGRGRKRRTHRRRNGKKHIVRRRKATRKH
jgi:hypothetical protein